MFSQQNCESSCKWRVSANLIGSISYLLQNGSNLLQPGVLRQQAKAQNVLETIWRQLLQKLSTCTKHVTCVTAKIFTVTFDSSGYEKQNSCYRLETKSLVTHNSRITIMKAQK